MPEPSWPDLGAVRRSIRLRSCRIRSQDARRLGDKEDDDQILTRFFTTDPQQRASRSRSSHGGRDDVQDYRVPRRWSAELKSVI